MILTLHSARQKTLFLLYCINWLIFLSFHLYPARTRAHLQAALPPAGDVMTETKKMDAMKMSMCINDCDSLRLLWIGKLGLTCFYFCVPAAFHPVSWYRTLMKCQGRFYKRKAWAAVQELLHCFPRMILVNVIPQKTPICIHAVLHSIIKPIVKRVQWDLNDTFHFPNGSFLLLTNLACGIWLYGSELT